MVGVEGLERGGGAMETEGRWGRVVLALGGAAAGRRGSILGRAAVDCSGPGGLGHPIEGIATPPRPRLPGASDRHPLPSKGGPIPGGGGGVHLPEGGEGGAPGLKGLLRRQRVAAPPGPAGGGGRPGETDPHAPVPGGPVVLGGLACRRRLLAKSDGAVAVAADWSILS